MLRKQIEGSFKIKTVKFFHIHTFEIFQNLYLIMIYK